MDGREIRGLKTMVVGLECCIDRESRLNSGSIQAGGVQGGNHSAGRYEISKERRHEGSSVGALTQQGGSPEVRAAKSSQS